MVNENTALDYRRRVCLAMDHISRHLDRELPLKEIAAAAAFSPYHFHRLFKAVVGETVADFRRRLRLERAANHLLTLPRRDITRIALECGFSSSQNFAKAFARHFGRSPSDYRRSKQGNILSKNGDALSLDAGYNSGIDEEPPTGQDLPDTWRRRSGTCRPCFWPMCAELGLTASKPSVKP